MDDCAALPTVFPALQAPRAQGHHSVQHWPDCHVLRALSLDPGSWTRQLCQVLLRSLHCRFCNALLPLLPHLIIDYSSCPTTGLSCSRTCTTPTRPLLTSVTSSGPSSVVPSPPSTGRFWAGLGASSCTTFLMTTYASTLIVPFLDPVLITLACGDRSRTTCFHPFLSVSRTLRSSYITGI
jgi:hypothetical protein